jgi:hypothetical protein
MCLMKSKIQQEYFVKFKLALTASVICSLLLIAAAFLSYDSNPFFMIYIIIALTFILLFSIVWSLVHLVRNFRVGKIYVIAPISVNIITIILLYTVPFSKIMLDLNFWYYYEDRMVVVEDVLNGRITENTLPLKQKDLSSDGRIEFFVDKEQKTIFFYTNIGVLDNFSGFMYRAPDLIPINGEINMQFGDFKRFEKIKDNWYYVFSY